jgi:hypothetical protein
MKKIITLLAGCSMVLAGAVIAQQPEGQESPAKKGGGKQKTEQPTETKPTRKAPAQTKGNAATAQQPTSAEANTPAPGAGKRQRRSAMGTAESPQAGAAAKTTGAETSPAAGGATNAPPQEAAGAKKGKKGRNAPTTTTAETGAAASPGATTQPMEQGKKGQKGKGAGAKAAKSASPSPAGAGTAAAASASPAINVPPATGATTPTTGAANAPATSAAAAAIGATGTTAMTKEQGTVGRGGKKVETQQIQQIKQQYASFRAQPKPDKAPAVAFDASRRIQGSQSWQGPQYEVFRVYHPEWHDQGWYRSHYGRVELIGGGYYFFNAGYWYPAWGYESSAAYYPYDGPIYVGHRAEPPDRVIADVQSVLQQMGYYTGEVDGLLGPLTRQALRDYQADHGLMVTEVIDEPTLDALQLS